MPPGQMLNLFSISKGTTSSTQFWIIKIEKWEENDNFFKKRNIFVQVMSLLTKIRSKYTNGL